MQSRDVGAGLALPGVPQGECGTRGRRAVPPTTKDGRFADRPYGARGNGRFRAVLVQFTLSPLRLPVRSDRTVRVFDLPSRGIGPRIGPHEPRRKFAEARFSPCENPGGGELQFDRFMGVPSLHGNFSGLWHGECWPRTRSLALAPNRAPRLVARV
jgi:hypothetical protein